MASTSKNAPRQRDTDPPQPPPFQRKIVIAPVQAIGVSVLAAIVVAALTGVLGQRSGRTQAAGGNLEVRVIYPEVLRYKTAQPLEIDIRNTGSVPVSRVEVRLDRRYLDGFQDVRFTPDAREIGARHVTVSIADVPAGESRTVLAWLQAHERGRRHAHLEVSADSRPALGLDWSTTVLP
jgi:hypothetical protein